MELGSGEVMLVSEEIGHQLATLWELTLGVLFDPGHFLSILHFSSAKRRASVRGTSTQGMPYVNGVIFVMSTT